MKKTLALIFAGLLLCSTVACSKQEDKKSETTTEKPAVTTTVETKNQEETTKADTAATAEETTEGEGTADGEATTDAGSADHTKDYYDDSVSVFDNANPNQSAAQIRETGKGQAVRFTLSDEQWLIGASVSCASWSDNFGSLTFYLYRWNTDYETTVAGEPVLKQTFEDFEDNSSLSMDFDRVDEKAIGAGTYLLVVKDGIDTQGTGVGVWTGSYWQDEDAEFYSSYDFVGYSNGRISKKNVMKATLVVYGYHPD